MWIGRNGSLNEDEMKNNADIIIAYYRSLNINDNTIAGILGNMQAESTINPLLGEVGGIGWGIVQWTPPSVLEEHANTLGLSPITSGDVQIEVIVNEIKGTPSSVREWYTSQAFINPYLNTSGATQDFVDVTAEQFLSNSLNWTPSKLAVLFMVAYERPNYNPDINHYQKRKEYADFWYEYITGLPPIPPTPTTSKKKKGFNWKVFTRVIRNNR